MNHATAKLETERTGVKIHPLDAAVFNVGPIANRVVRRFATKLSLAAHYQISGKIVPSSGGVVIIWSSNYDATTGRLPDEAIALLGPTKTLQQGKKEVSDQFGYSYRLVAGGEMSLIEAHFRQAVMFVAFVRTDRSKFSKIGDMTIHQPFNHDDAKL